jgi:excisionase family DNA binding protein
MGNGEHMSDMLTIREVARLFHVHPNTLRRWSNNGRIRAYRITPRGDRRFKREEIAHFLDELNGHGDNGQEAESRQRSG